MNPILVKMRLQGANIVAYIDDFWTCHRNRDRYRELTFLLIHHLESLGFVMNREKSLIDPVQKLTYSKNGDLLDKDDLVSSGQQKRKPVVSDSADAKICWSIVSRDNGPDRPARSNKTSIQPGTPVLQENTALAINTSQGDVNAIACNTTVRTESTGRTPSVDHWIKLLSILQLRAIVKYMVRFIKNCNR